jgi:hypothetical protein
LKKSMIVFRGLACCGFLCLFVTGPGALASSTKTPCTPVFPLRHGLAQGWLGADAAYSIPLPDGRDVWIFGDTLYGEHREVSGGIPKMVRNSIGISTCSRGRWKLQYVIRHDEQGHPADFFHAQHLNTWYWAMDGFVSGNDVWVTLLCVRDAAAKTQAMAFRTCGTDLARISSPGPNPQEWKIDYFPLVPDGKGAYPSATVVADGEDAYLFALRESGSRSLVATRVPVDGLSDPAKNLQFLASDGQWQAGFDPAQAQAVMEKGSPELSIRYHPELKKWLAVMFEPDAFSSKILLRMAPNLTGPWTQGDVIYIVPDMQPANPGYNKNTFCYAAKEHPEFERGDLVFTYVCNTFDVPSLATNLSIYFPHAVRMAMPPQ